MDNVTRILRPVILFAWPIPILASIGQRFGDTWPGYLAYVAAVVLAVAAVVVGWLAFRATRKP